MYITIQLRALDLKQSSHARERLPGLLHVGVLVVEGRCDAGVSHDGDDDWGGDLEDHQERGD